MRSAGERAALIVLLAQHAAFSDGNAENASRSLTSETELAQQIRRQIGTRIRKDWQRDALAHAAAIDRFVETWNRQIHARPAQWDAVAQDYNQHKAEINRARNVLLALLRGQPATRPAAGTPLQAASVMPVTADLATQEPAPEAVEQLNPARESATSPESPPPAVEADRLHPDPDGGAVVPVPAPRLAGRAFGVAAVTAVVVAGLTTGILVARSGGDPGKPAATTLPHPNAAPTFLASVADQPATATSAATPNEGKIVTLSVAVSLDSKGTATAKIHVATSNTDPVYVTITWAGSRTHAAGDVGTRTIQHHLLAGAGGYDLTEYAGGKLYCPATFLGITVIDDAGQATAYSSAKSAC